MVLGAGSWSWFALRQWILEAGVRAWWWSSLLAMGVAFALVEAQSIGIGGRLRMPRDRPRMGSRRGGIQGRAPPRDDHYSPSSSIEVTSQPRWFQDNNDEVGGQKESSPIDEDSQREFPMLRYRLPCPHVNSSLIVSIAVEPGIEPQSDRQRSSREDSPVACLPVGAEIGWAQPERIPGPGWSEPRHAGGLRLERPAPNLDPDVGPSMRAATTLPGPSKPAQKDSPHKIIQLSDSENSLHFGCQIAEALQSTDEE